MTRRVLSHARRLTGPLTRQFTLLLALALLVVVAGCATTPTETTTTNPGTETFEVQMTGNSSATYVVSADLVADPFENVTVTYANGSSRAIPVPAQQSAVTYGPESGVTGVEPTGEVVGGVYFEGSPNFTVTANEVPPTGNVVYSVRRKTEEGRETERNGSGSSEPLVAWGLIQCDGHVTGLSLRVNETGVEGLGFGCSS